MGVPEREYTKRDYEGNLIALQKKRGDKFENNVRLSPIKESTTIHSTPDEKNARLQQILHDSKLTNAEKKELMKKVTSEIQFQENGYEASRKEYIKSSNSNYASKNNKTTFNGKNSLSQKFKLKINRAFNAVKNISK